MKTLLYIKLFYLRSLKQTLRNPVRIFASLFEPLLYLFLFMPLLKNLGDVPGLPQGKSVAVFIPGLLIMMTLFGSAFVGFGLIDEIRSGVIERFLVTPVNRSSILWGRILRDGTILLAQCVVIVFAAIPFGLVVSLKGLSISLLLYILSAIAMAAMSYGFALIYKIEDNLAVTINMISLPICLLSGILLPLALAPLWLQKLSKANPFFYVVEATRALFFGNFQGPEVIYGFFSIALLALVTFLFSLKALNKMAS